MNLPLRTDFNFGVADPYGEHTDQTMTTDGFPFMLEHQIMEMQPPEYIIDEWLPEDCLILMWGAPKTTKSFEALHMALCITHGMKWYGHDVRQGAVCYIAAEGVGGFGKRVKAWKKHFGYAKSSPFVVITTPVNMTKTEEVAKLIAQMKQMEIDYGFKFVMTFVDTLARCSAGSEENSNTAMGLAVENSEQIRVQVQTGVCDVHHSGKNEAAGPRGASALFGAVNTGIYVEREGSSPYVVLTLAKQKDDEDGKSLHLEIKTIPLAPRPNGKPQSSLVLLERIEQIHVATARDMPGEARDTVHIDLLSIAAWMTEGVIETVSNVTVGVFGNLRNRERVTDAVPEVWTNVTLPSGSIRCIRRQPMKGKKGEAIECRRQ